MAPVVNARGMTPLPPKLVANDHESKMVCGAKKLGDFFFHFPFSIFWLAATELKPRKSADELGSFGSRLKTKSLPLADPKVQTGVHPA